MLTEGYVESDWMHENKSFPLAVKSYILEKNAIKAGCTLWYETVVTGIYIEDNRVVGVRCLHNGSTKYIKTRIVIDCTGDSTLCRMAGCKMHTGRKSDGISQQFSRAVGVVKDSWYIQGVWQHCGRIEKYDAKSLSDAIIKAGSEPPCLLDFYDGSRRIICEAAILGIRESHRVEAEEVFSFKDYIEGKRYDKPIYYTFETGTSDSSVPEKKTYNLNGSELLILTSVAMVPKMEDQWTNKMDEVRYKLYKEAEELYNCKFNFEVVTDLPGTANKVASSVMAGVYMCDLFYCGRANAFPSLEKNNILLPLNDYIDFNQPVYQEHQHVNGLVNPDKIYTFFNTYLTPVGVFYNRDILEREGLPDPQDLADGENWNWNNFLDIAIKTTHDYNGDGIIDQWGVGGSNAQLTAIAIMRSNLAPMIAYSKQDNKYIYNLQNPDALKALQFLSDLYHTYKVTPINAEPGFKNGTVAMFLRDAWYGANLKPAGLRLGFELLPQGPDNHGQSFMRELAGNYYFFPSNISNPEAVVNAIAHWLVFWDSSKSIYATDEDLLLSNAQSYFDSEKERARFMEYMKYPLTYDYINFFTAAQNVITNSVFNPLSKERISPVPSIEAIKDQAQTIIDDIMEK